MQELNIGETNLYIGYFTVYEEMKKFIDNFGDKPTLINSQRDIQYFKAKSTIENIEYIKKNFNRLFELERKYTPFDYRFVDKNFVEDIKDLFILNLFKEGDFKKNERKLYRIRMWGNKPDNNSIMAILMYYIVCMTKQAQKINLIKEDDDFLQDFNEKIEEIKRNCFAFNFPDYYHPSYLISI